MLTVGRSANKRPVIAPCANDCQRYKQAMPRNLFVLTMALLFVLRASATEVQRNLVANSGFEETKEKLPAQWTPLTLGPSAQCEIDRQIKHGGAQSVRISAGEVTRTYVLSEYIPVAPGESVSASAWVKCKDVPEGKGTTIVIGEFSDS